MKESDIVGKVIYTKNTSFLGNQIREELEMIITRIVVAETKVDRHQGSKEKVIEVKEMSESSKMIFF